MNEKLIEKKLIKWARSLKGEAYKWWPVSVTGLPDRIVLLPGGRIGFAEIKTTGEGLRPRQKIVIRFLLKLGFIVGIVDSQESLDEFSFVMDSDNRDVKTLYREKVKRLLETKYA